jgi:2-hydroxy-3-oxopropionate reductase
MAVERIGFIGLGIMGRPMAKHLLKAGYSLTVYDIMPAGVQDVVAAGAKAAGSNKEVAQNSDIVITMVPDSPDVEAAYLGANGVFEGLRAGMTCIDMSSISPVVSRKVAALAAEKGVEVLDAPVSGGEVGAENATLSIMVGGKPEVFERMLPLLQLMGKNITLVGDAGAGQVAKACNQMIVGITLGAVAEALVLAQKAGVDPAKVRQALLGGFAQSRILELHGQRMLDRKFEPGFRIRLQEKDLNVALSAAREYGVSLPLTATVEQEFKALLTTGRGNDDHSGVAKFVESMAGIELKGGPVAK